MTQSGVDAPCKSASSASVKQPQRTPFIIFVLTHLMAFSQISNLIALGRQRLTNVRTVFGVAQVDSATEAKTDRNTKMRVVNLVAIFLDSSGCGHR